MSSFRLWCKWFFAVTWLLAIPAAADPPPAAGGTFRVATYNISFYRDRQGKLIDDLERGDSRAHSIAEVIQRVRPDVLLLNEFDFDADSRGAKLFCEKYLKQPQNDQQPIEFAHQFTAPVNTGVPTKMDLDRDGRTDGPGDAFGWGPYPGKYGMVVLSRFPIDRDQVATFQHLLWQDMPDRKIPVDPATDAPYYSAEVDDIFRLSSKSHWIVPIDVELEGNNIVLNLIASHPTPPVFDGPEDRNGLRNHDEIRLLADLVSPDLRGYIRDDRGRPVNLAADARFIIVGDLNADPIDGDSSPAAIRQLLEHPAIDSSLVPRSDGGVASSRRQADLNRDHQGDPQFDTADFGGDGHGNLRVDYVLPSRTLEPVAGGVFWPRPDEPGSEAIKATDHRLVWLDLRPASPPSPRTQASE